MNQNISYVKAFDLVIGVICGSAKQISPLVDSILQIGNCGYLKSIKCLILINGEKKENIDRLLAAKSDLNPKVSFDIMLPDVVTIEKPLPISTARTILQRRMGIILLKTHGAFGWLLDDDMIIPQIATIYLKWLPTLKLMGIDVIIGCFSGSSPNPPAHGIRVQVNDLVHNLTWFDSMNDDDILPNKANENYNFRSKYTDYYYDLSRKHVNHLDEPYWWLPKHSNETVGSAKIRLLTNLDKILTGEPFLRPLVPFEVSNPLDQIKPSCNRGGNTFILSAKSLLNTPNYGFKTKDGLNRRSDMIWAIINRYYYNQNIVAIPFYVIHNRFIGNSTQFNFIKTVSEIQGAAMYAALIEFFSNYECNQLEVNKIEEIYCEYINNRLMQYKINFEKIVEDLVVIEKKWSIQYPILLSFVNEVKKWVSKENIKKIEEHIWESFSMDDINRIVNDLNNIPN